MFETNGIINEYTIKELKVIAISPKKKKFFRNFSIIYSLLGLLSIVLGLVVPSIIGIAVGFLCEVLAVSSIGIILYSQNLFQKNNIETLKEVSNENCFNLKTIFNEYGAVINNLTTSSKVEIKYEYFERFAETSNMYLLITKSGQQTITFKNCLNDEEKKSFKEFIKGKCKNIQWDSR